MLHLTRSSIQGKKQLGKLLVWSFHSSTMSR